MKQAVLPGIYALILLYCTGCQTLDQSALQREKQQNYSKMDLDNAKILVLETQRTLSANLELTRKVAEQLSEIKRQFPEFQNVNARPIWSPNRLLIKFSPEFSPNNSSPTATPWTKFASEFKLIEATPLKSAGWWIVNFEESFYPPRAIEKLAGMPEIIVVEPDRIIGDGSDICLTVKNGQFFYIFDIAEGDCPAGCINHSYFGVITHENRYKKTSINQSKASTSCRNKL